MFRVKNIFLILSLILSLFSIKILLTPFSKGVQAAYTQPRAFAPPVPYQVGNGPIGMAVGDFMGLGFQDIAVTNEFDNTISILANNGLGVFTVQTPIALADNSNPVTIVSGDFTGQGHQDLAVTDIGDGTVSILLNDGNGVFTQQTPIAVGRSPVGIVAGNFMGQGHRDLAITNNLDNTVQILANNGSGIFTPQTPIAVGKSPLLLLNGNFMGLGNQDLAVPNVGDNTVSILANNGQGVFTLQTPIDVGRSPVSLATGNFMGLDHQDLAVTNQVDNTISILANDGHGVFTPDTTISVGNQPREMIVGNFMGQGRQDIAVTNAADDTVLILANNGDGTFTTRPPIPVGSNPIGLAVGSFTSLGHQDIVTANFNENTITILLNRFTSTTPTPTPTPTPTTTSTTPTATSTSTPTSTIPTCSGIMDADENISACNTLIALDISPGTLSNQVPANVTFTSGNVQPASANNANPFIIANGLDQVVDFQFIDSVIDTRNAQAGWSLAAQSTGLTGTQGDPAITAITLSGDLADSTCDSTTVCTPPIANLLPGTNLILNATAQPFMNAPTGGTGDANHGDYHIVASGSFTVPAAAFAATTYSGTITVTLINAAS